MHGRPSGRAHRWAAAALAASLSPSAAADVPSPEPSARAAAPHAAYVEALGKGGVYGVGYDWAFADRFAVGGLGSFLIVDGERVLTLAPYVNAYPLAGRRSALLVQLGADVVYVDVPSRVAGFSGTSSTGVAGQLSVGYEYRSPFLFRVLASALYGRGGFRPWIGLGFGGTFR